MECLGGVGYCENNEDGELFNISKIFCDSLVNPIWERTVSVIAEDVVRVLTDKRHKRKILKTVLQPWALGVLGSHRETFPHESTAVEQRLDALIALEDKCDKQELLYQGRALLEHMEAVICSVLLIYDAAIDANEVAAEIARRWVRFKALTPMPVPARSWGDQSAMDKEIFLGPGRLPATAYLGKL